MAPHAAPRESMNSGQLPPEGDGAGGGSIGARGDKVVTDSARVVDSDPAPPVGEELATYPQALLSGGIRSIGPEKNSSSSLVGAREENRCRATRERLSPGGRMRSSRRRGASSGGARTPTRNGGAQTAISRRPDATATKRAAAPRPTGG